MQPGFLYFFTLLEFAYTSSEDDISLIITKIFAPIEILAMKKSQLWSQALFIHLTHDQQVIIEFCVDNKMKLILWMDYHVTLKEYWKILYCVF